MNAYPDTSFLQSLYVARDTSNTAAAYVRSLEAPICISTLALYEFEHSIRFAAWLSLHDRKRIFTVDNAQSTLAHFEADIESGSVQIHRSDYEAVLAVAGSLSNTYTWRGGHRAFDLFHVATAQHLGAKTFLSFDANQRRLAEAVGLKVGP